MRAARALAAEDLPAVAVLTEARLFIETCEKNRENLGRHFWDILHFPLLGLRGPR